MKNICLDCLGVGGRAVTVTGGIVFYCNCPDEVPTAKPVSQNERDFASMSNEDLEEIRWDISCEFGAYSRHVAAIEGLLAKVAAQELLLQEVRGVKVLESKTTPTVEDLLFRAQSATEIAFKGCLQHGNRRCRTC